MNPVFRYSHDTIQHQNTNCNTKPPHVGSRGLNEIGVRCDHRTQSTKTKKSIDMNACLRYTTHVIMYSRSTTEGRGVSNT